jgi:hypothetical protein
MQEMYFRFWSEKLAESTLPFFSLKISNEYIFVLPQKLLKRASVFRKMQRINFRLVQIAGNALSFLTKKSRNYTSV